MHPTPADRGRFAVPARRRGRRAAVAVATALGALALAPAAGAAPAPTYYVDGSSLGGRCSDVRSAAENRQATPWCSIATGLAKATPGSRVLIRAGTYGRVAASDLRRTDYVTVSPFPGETPRIAGFDLARVDHLRFEGLTVLGGFTVRSGSELQFVDNDLQIKPAGARTASGFTLFSVQSVLIYGNHVANGRDGVNLLGSTPATTDVVIWDNHFEGLGNDAVHVGSGTARILIAANFMDDCRLRREIDPTAHADGIQAMAPSQDVIAWGNYVAGGRGFLFMVSPRYENRRDFGHRGTVIANNVFVGRDFALRTASIPGAKIVNNTVWGTSSGDMTGMDIRDRVGRLNARSTDLVVANNVVKRLRFAGPVTFERREDNLVQRGAAGPEDLLGTPAFVDAAAGDMRLVAGSLGVDAADPVLAPPVDIEGRLRQTRPDIGAYETDGPRVAGIWVHLPADVSDILTSADAEAEVGELGFDE